ncbi:hypothetical protein E3U55_03960 [Filobacillus milosensis]|uniref:Uncharacterized protein n=1 Tax=Filobacillus milosensis TaxID=94137 RepID=A0A4Y8IQZ2_9BACI|nr:sporulation protein YpjB [Filobacillus milosensis]TFB23976.1 hypothetical protein E3U55_03960 [Filobacillus milosensis]
MTLTIGFLIVIATHSSLSGFLITLIIVFGSVFITLIYVGWRKYRTHEIEEARNNDQHNNDSD